MPDSVRCIVELHRHDGQYNGTIHNAGMRRTHALTNLQLGAQAPVTIQGRAYTLGALVQALIGYQDDDLQTAYNERGQLEIGRHLYTQVFGGLDPEVRRRLRERPVEVRLVTEDEHLTRLPWPLLTDGSVFLCTTGWSVGLSRTMPSGEHELPPSPRMLIIAPQPVGVPETGAARHLDDLETLLAGADPRHVRGQALQVVETWEALTETVSAFRPQVVYYYGHGIGDPQTSRLVFASRQANRRVDIPMADLAACLRQSPDGAPLLAYLNCCQGDAGGLLGAGRVLGDDIPAVVTNRTVAHIDAAAAQGLAFWCSVLHDGAPPHMAVAEVHRNLIQLGLSVSNERWMTPVLHCHYDTWRANPPRPRNRLEYDPHWRLKFDRVRQFAQVFYLTDQMLRERRPRTLAYVWYGQRGQGVDLFHQRLAIELSEKLPAAAIYEVKPEWPLALDQPERAFAAMLTDAFAVNTLEDIPARVRTQNRGVSGRQTLVYVRHVPVESRKLIHPRILKRYLEWWDECIAPLFGGQTFAVLGVSFVVDDPVKFHDVLTKRAQIPDLFLRSTVIQVLDEMEKVSRKDLLDFLNTHNIPVPFARRDRVLDDILAQTHGHYDLTLEALKSIAEQAWIHASDATSAVASEADDEEY